MPIYEFRCEACGEVFERIVQGGAPPPPACPACGAGNAARTVAAFAARTSVQRRGGVVDLSSGACPCGGHAHAH